MQKKKTDQRQTNDKINKTTIKKFKQRLFENQTSAFVYIIYI